MKVALVQLNTVIGDFEGTYQKMLNSLEKAQREGVSLVLFSEMITTGYPPRDLLEHESFIQNNLNLKDRMVGLSGQFPSLTLMFGFVDIVKKKKVKRLFNALAVVQNGKLLEVYHKKLLPQYDVFDESRYFEAGEERGSLILRLQEKEWSVGLSICEDIWTNEIYNEDPLESISSDCDFIINLSASPFESGKQKVREDLLRRQTKKYQVPFLYVNTVGGQDELVFDGRSFVMDKDGNIAARAKAFEEDFLIYEFGFLKNRIETEVSGMEEVYRALVLGTRDYVRKCGFEKVLIGLSGGVDSSLVLAVAVEALGASQVKALMMPSPYSSSHSIEDAREMAKNLKVDVFEYPIHEIYKSYRQSLGRHENDLPDLADENVQARIRGNLLMALSNRDGAMVLTTGNKSELSVGYCTLYGDMSGGLAVIADLYKTQVYELCRWIQGQKKIFPDRVLTKAPSAELRPDQTDQDSLPPYPVLDAILKLLIEDRLSTEEVISKGYEPKLVGDVIKLVVRNEYKRRQAAPGLKISSKAFGVGRRYPIAKQNS